MAALQRQKELRRKRKRREKLRKLRKEYIGAKTQAEKDLIWKKVIKIAPWLSLEEFLKPTTQER